jgi:hypothetical protein
VSLECPFFIAPSVFSDIYFERVSKFVHDVNYFRLSINTKPLDLVYNPATVRRIREFFSSRNKGIARVSKLQLTGKQGHS